ncbi:MAG: SH3 domain-containing protein [Alphaproteobacteria bacterium]
MTGKNLGISVAIILCVPWLLAMSVSARELLRAPTYFQVAGVAGDDVLNVRGAPRASSPIVGELAPNAWPVEVLKTKNGWAYVAAGEGMGWASMRFLAEISLPRIGQTTLPEGLVCGGTEPFWGAALSAEKILYNTIDGPNQDYLVTQTGQVQNRGGMTSFVLGQGTAKRFTAIISNQICSDGMSDRDYPRRIDLLLSGSGGALGFSGCCHMPLVN